MNSLEVSIKQCAHAGLGNTVLFPALFSVHDYTLASEVLPSSPRGTDRVSRGAVADSGQFSHNRVEPSAESENTLDIPGLLQNITTPHIVDHFLYFVEDVS